jgi:hypothetical protein
LKKKIDFAWTLSTEKLIFNQDKTQQPTTISNQPTMSLTKAIQKSIEKNIDKFVTEIEAKFGVSKTDLINIWKDVSKMNIKNKDKKLSPWLQFCKDQRVIIKKNHPEMSFGDISKMIGLKWKDLTKEQKKTYKSYEDKPEPVVEESVNLLNETMVVDEETMVVEEETHNDETMVVKETHIDEIMVVEEETHNDETMVDNDMYPTSEKLKEYDEDDLKKMKISQLKDMCKNMLLSKTGKKEDLVRRLLSYKNSPYYNNSPSPVHSDDDDE